MNREYKEVLSQRIYDNFATLEDQIMADIVRRIKKTGEITSTADWQINRLIALGYSSEDVEREIKKALDASYPDMFELYDKVIDWEYVRNKDIYEQINGKFIPYEENLQLQQITEAYIRQTQSELSNITQSMGFYLDYGEGKKVFTPLADVYQNFLDNAIYGITSGAFDYNTMIRKAVTELTNSGLRSIDYASGYCSRTPVAARRAVMTGITQLTGKITDMNAEKLGTEYFEVAWHSGARPTHQNWQGKVWSKKQLTTVCGLGLVTGLCGANCYHEYYPFFPGLSERNWSDTWLKEENQKENTPVEFKGKEYTLYEARQKQRQMETAMRAQRQKVNLLSEAGVEPDEVMLTRCKYQAQLDEYGKFSKKMGLKQERDRIYLDMKGRVAPNTKDYRGVASKLESQYNKGDTIENIKICEKDKKLQKNIRSGKVSKTIESGKQGKHIKGHNNYIPGRSYLSISEEEAQELVNKYAGTGMIRRDGKDRWKNKETVSADRIIGYCVDQVSGAEKPTKSFTIHYSKKGVHIVPSEEVN